MPFDDIGVLTAAGFDGVTSALRVNASVHKPLACVVDVFKVASGKLSLPGKVRQQASGQARAVAASTAWPIDCQKKNRRSL